MFLLYLSFCIALLVKLSDWELTKKTPPKHTA